MTGVHQQRRKSMTTPLTIECRQKTNKGTALGFEGKVAIPGLKTTKLTRKDGTTLFPTTSSLKATGRALAKRLRTTAEFTAPVAKAAKKSVKSRTTSKSAKRRTARKSSSSPKSRRTTSKTSSKSRTSRPKQNRLQRMQSRRARQRRS